MVADGSGKYVYNATVIRLTYDIAEYLIHSEPAGKGPGVLALRFQDDVRLQGWYVAYIQIERVGEAQVQPHRAAFVSQSVPATVKAGASFDAEIRMRNTGTEVWVPDGANPYSPRQPEPPGQRELGNGSRGTRRAGAHPGPRQPSGSGRRRRLCPAATVSSGGWCTNG